MNIQKHSSEEIKEEFWRRFDEELISEEDLLYQLETTGYPEEVLAPLKAYCAQPVANREKLAAWCGDLKRKAELC